MAEPGDLVPCLRELPAELGVVVDLSVEGEHIPAARTGHRLVTGRREIDNRQTPVTKADPRRLVDPNAFVVGAAVGQRRGHGPHVTRRNASGTENSGYSTHAGLHTGEAVVRTIAASEREAAWRLSPGVRKDSSSSQKSPNARRHSSTEPDRPGRFGKSGSSRRVAARNRRGTFSSSHYCRRTRTE